MQRKAFNPSGSVFLGGSKFTWIPAHKLENLVENELTEEVAAAAGTTVRHIRLNRIADQEAKKQALLASPVRPEIQRQLLAATTLHQEWLTRLHCHLDTSSVCDATNEDNQPHRQAGAEDLTLANAPGFFPKWPWGVTVAGYSWKPKIPATQKPPKKWRHSEHDWEVICAFLRNLRWKIGSDESAAFCELAIALHVGGHQLDNHASLLIHDVLTKVRQCLQWLAKDPQCQPFPGEMSPGFAKSCGRVLCQGAVVGASFYMSDVSRLFLAAALKAGAGRTTESWKTPFPS